MGKHTDTIAHQRSYGGDIKRQSTPTGSLYVQLVKINCDNTTPSPVTVTDVGDLQMVLPKGALCLGVEVVLPATGGATQDFDLGTVDTDNYFISTGDGGAAPGTFIATNSAHGVDIAGTGLSENTPLYGVATTTASTTRLLALLRYVIFDDGKAQG